MPARTGEQFLRGLVDDREVWVGSDKVASPVDHPSLRGAALALAEVFDLQHREADACLMPDPETGEPINVSHMIPKSPRGFAAPASRARMRRRVFGRADGAHAGLHERHLCRLCRTRRRMGGQW